MTVVSRRILVPTVGKTELALERAKRLESILARLGGMARTCRVVCGEDVGALEVLCRFPDFSTASKFNAALAGDAEMQKLFKEREANPAAAVAGPYLYRSVFGEAVKMPVMVQREWRVSRENLPEIVKLLPEAWEAVARKPMMAVVPVFSPEMDRLVIVYYNESLQEMGENLDKYGMSEAFQAAVHKASRYGQPVKARVLAQV